MPNLKLWLRFNSEKGETIHLISTKAMNIFWNIVKIIEVAETGIKTTLCHSCDISFCSKKKLVHRFIFCSIVIYSVPRK